MIELIYKNFEDGIHLYELERGIRKFICIAQDREELLCYIENNYDLVKLIISRGDIE